MKEIAVGTKFTAADDEHHEITAVTDEHVITSHEGGERVWRRADVEARLGLNPLIPDEGIVVIETAGPYQPTLHVEGSTSPVLMWTMYRTGRSLTIHPNGTWTENDRAS